VSHVPPPPGPDAAAKRPYFADPNITWVVALGMAVVSFFIFGFLAFGAAIVAGFGIVDGIRTKAGGMVIGLNVVAFVVAFAMNVLRQIQ
jgi:hypothetical protein